MPMGNESLIGDLSLRRTGLDKKRSCKDVFGLRSEWDEVGTTLSPCFFGSCRHKKITPVFTSSPRDSYPNTIEIMTTLSFSPYMSNQTYLSVHRILEFFRSADIDVETVFSGSP
jgi:hypothetical protein